MYLGWHNIRKNIMNHHKTNHVVLMMVISKASNSCSSQSSPFASAFIFFAIDPSEFVLIVIRYPHSYIISENITSNISLTE